MLIAVTGYKNSGKNAVCDVLRDEYGFKVTGFADALKAQMLAIDPLVPHYYPGRFERLSYLVERHGWDDAKETFPEVRRLLQKAGTEGGRDIFGQEIWGETWLKTAAALLEQEYDVCVSDMRFLNEASAITDLGGETWRVIRPGTGPGEHKSERELDDITYEWGIRNDGSLADLELQVKRIMERES